MWEVLIAAIHLSFGLFGRYIAAIGVLLLSSCGHNYLITRMRSVFCISRKNYFIPFDYDIIKASLTIHEIGDTNALDRQVILLLPVWYFKTDENSRKR